MLHFVPVKGNAKDYPIKKDYIYLDDSKGSGMCAKYNWVLDNYDCEWYCFHHDDFKFLTDEIEICKELERAKEHGVGVAGVIGTYCVEPSLSWWTPFRYCNGAGHIKQVKLDKKTGKPVEPYETYDMNDWPGRHYGMASVDGCVLFISKDAVKKGIRFDDETITGYHFYDIDICIQALSKQIGVGVLNIDSVHESAGKVPLNWEELRKPVYEKWSARIPIWPITKYTKFYND